MRLLLLLLSFVATGCAAPPPRAPASGKLAPSWPSKTHYRSIEVLGHRVFYREAGGEHETTIVLLHGFPSSSHTYRELIPLLSGRFHVLAPDYLGSGYSDQPHPETTSYTFDRLAEHVTAWLEALGVSHCVFYLQDFGAPVGFRVAMNSPERVLGLVVQNANAYLDGLTPRRREFFRNARNDGSADNLAELRSFVGDEAIQTKQYLRDVPGDKASRMSPDAWTHDIARMPTEAERQIQVQLFRDYQNNIDAYPKWQAYLRAHQPPALVVWGRHDPAFVAAGAEAYRRDLPHVEVHLIDAGHFAVEEQPVLVAQHVTRFVLGLSEP